MRRKGNSPLRRSDGAFLRDPLELVHIVYVLATVGAAAYAALLQAS